MQNGAAVVNSSHRQSAIWAMRADGDDTEGAEIAEDTEGFSP